MSGRIALVLAGGAARGAYEVGVVQHLLQEVARVADRNQAMSHVHGRLETRLAAAAPVARPKLQAI